MFSATVQEHTYQPRNVGELPSATHHGVAGVPGDGPYMLLWFEVVGDTIVKATYDTYGCPAAIASGSIAAQVLHGRTKEQALLLTAHDITLLLGGLPEGKAHCPELVVTAVRDAFSE